MEKNVYIVTSGAKYRTGDKVQIFIDTTSNESEDREVEQDIEEKAKKIREPIRKKEQIKGNENFILRLKTKKALGKSI